MTQEAAFAAEVAAAPLRFGPGESLDLVDERAVAGYAEPIRRYFAFMRVVGQPRVWSFRCRWAGGFRRRPDAPFWPCEMWQYNTRIEIARISRLRVRTAPLVAMTAHDTYVDGRGRMRATVLKWISVVDASGPELDTGELVTYLNDAILLAPAMLLGPEAQLTPVDEHGFTVALTDRGRTVTARVYIDERGAPVDFHTTDRFVEDPAHHGRWLRCAWRTPIDGWQTVGGWKLPSAGRAIWELPSGPFTYVELSPIADSFAVNIQPR